MSKATVAVQISPKLAYILDSLASDDSDSIERAIWHLLDNYGYNIASEEYADKLKNILEEGVTAWLR